MAKKHVNPIQLVKDDDLEGLKQAIAKKQVDDERLSWALGSAIQTEGREHFIDLLLARKGKVAGHHLVNAAGAGNPAVVAKLLAKPHDLSYEIMGETALTAAAANGHTAVVTQLLAAGADPNVHASDLRATQPLIASLQGKHADAALALVAGGADPNFVTKDSEKPIDIARKHKLTKVVAALAKMGGKTVGDDDITDWRAAELGRVDLLKKRLPKISKDDRGSLLLGAAQEGQAAVIECILAAKPDQGSIDRALWAAAQDGHVAAIKALLAGGATHTVHSDATPLMKAAVGGYVEAVKVLLAGGADPAVRDEDGRTALDLAHHQPKVLAILKKTGVKPLDKKKVRTQMLRAVSKLKRAAWRPKFGITVGDSHFGGVPALTGAWPRCPDCKKLTTFFLQLDLAKLPPAVKSKGLLQLWLCLEDNKAHVAVAAAGGTKKPPRVAALPARYIVGWSEVVDYPYRDPALDGVKLPLGADLFPLNLQGDKLGGWPVWIQDPQYPKGTDRLLMQLASSKHHMFGDNGFGYVLQSSKDRSRVAYVWQTS